MRLELLHRLRRVVDECETGRLAATVVCSEAEAVYLVFVGFVEFGKLASEFVLRDIGAVRMEDITARIESARVLESCEVQLEGAPSLTQPFVVDQGAGFG